jgi:hypothetical protein
LAHAARLMRQRRGRRPAGLFPVHPDAVDRCAPAAPRALGYHELVSFASMVQEELEGLDFVTWISDKPQEAFFELTVGDVADFIVASSVRAQAS